MCFGGLRRSEIVALHVGDIAPGLGLRRVQGKGGTESAVPLPVVAQNILASYIATVRANAKASDPLFVSRSKAKDGQLTEARMKGPRVWKITKAFGQRAGIPEIHPHAFRHSSGVQVLHLSGGGISRGPRTPPAPRHPDDDGVHAAHAVRLTEGDQQVGQEQRG
jgi:site-specific recombinase XerD